MTQVSHKTIDEVQGLFSNKEFITCPKKALVLPKLRYYVKTNYLCTALAGRLATQLAVHHLILKGFIYTYTHCAKCIYFSIQHNCQILPSVHEEQRVGIDFWNYFSYSFYNLNEST